MIWAMRNPFAESPRDRADEHCDRARCARIYNQNGFLRAGENFLLESTV